MRALIVDVEAAARDTLRGVLHALPEVMYVAECATAGEAQEVIRREPPDIAFVDPATLGPGGLPLVAALRRQGTPALVLMSTHCPPWVRGWRRIAVDQLAKPFEAAPLAAAVRRAATSARLSHNGRLPAVDYFGDVAVEYRAHRVLRAGRRLDLRPKEYQLLVALLRRAGAVARREDLLREVWGYAPRVVSRTVDTHIAALRRRVESNPAEPRHILTVRQFGYRLDREGLSRVGW